MADPARLEELAKRLESAPGPDRELSEEVARAHGWKVHPVASRNTLIRPDGQETRKPPPHYTASIDAAMTLVPEGCMVAVTNCDVSASAPDFTKASALVARDPDSEPDPRVAATPALALCAAALRSLAQQEGER